MSIENIITAWCQGPDNSSNISFICIEQDKIFLSIGSPSTRNLRIVQKGGNSFSVETDDEFLVENFFLDNVEDAVNEASSIEEVLTTLSEVYRDMVSGDASGEDQEMDDGEEYEYASDGEQMGMSSKTETKVDRATKDGYDDVLPNLSAGAARRGNHRLLQDLAAIMRTDTHSLGFSLEPKNEDSLDRWVCKLFNFEDCALVGDLERLKQVKNMDYIELELQFKQDYPFSPPFIRVVYPRFKFHTGHVTIGGSICMELLTNSGWTPTNDIESVIIQIRSEMIAGNAQIDFQHDYPYSEQEAKSAFSRVASQHGWAI